MDFETMLSSYDLIGCIEPFLNLRDLLVLRSCSKRIHAIVNTKVLTDAGKYKIYLDRYCAYRGIKREWNYSENITIDEIMKSLPRAFRCYDCLMKYRIITSPIQPQWRSKQRLEINDPEDPWIQQQCKCFDCGHHIRNPTDRITLRFMEWKVRKIRSESMKKRESISNKKRRLSY